MITIAIADLNEIYCQGIKTMLEQIGEFRVKILNPSLLDSSLKKEPNIDVFMIDEDLFLTSGKAIKAMESRFPSVKKIILTMDSNSAMVHPDEPETIYKGCGKAEFARRITGIIHFDSLSKQRFV